MKTVVIVGGGFSGAMTAVHLLSDPRCDDLNVALIESRSQPGLGVAYSTPSPHHLLNIPAGRMSALPDAPNDFLAWLTAQAIPANADSFVPRRLFGAYVAEKLSNAAARAGRRFTQIVGEVVDIQVAPDRKSARAILPGERSVAGDYIVLATGHAPAADPLAGIGFELPATLYTRDAWGMEGLSLVPLNAPVLLIGTGLTMVDMAVDLHKRGHRGGLVAISRHGRLNRPQLITHPQIEIRPPHELLQGSGKLTEVFALIRAAVDSNRRVGYDWRETVKSLRSVTADIWQRFSYADGARFLRHVQVYWETHRHLIPPESAVTVTELCKRREMQVLAGRITAITKSAGGLRIAFRRRGSESTSYVQVGHIINCTSPQADVARRNDPLIRRLLNSGLISRDPLGLGVVTDDHGSLIDAAGRPSSLLFTLGPWRRAQLLESIAVPELKHQAADLAHYLVGRLLDSQPDSLAGDRLRAGSPLRAW